MEYLLDLRNNGSLVFFGKPRWVLDGAELEHPPHLVGPTCCLIHGYNVKNAEKSYRTIIENMQDVYEHFVKVLWPGSEISLAFWLASIRAGKAGKMLASAIDAPVLDICGHSLGAKVAMEAVCSGLYARNVILAGPALDNEALEIDGKYGCAKAELILVFYSNYDPVLRGAYTLARLDRALGAAGPQNFNALPLNVRVIDLSDVVKDHSTYKDVVLFYKHWRTVCQ